MAQFLLRRSFKRKTQAECEALEIDGIIGTDDGEGGCRAQER